MENVSRASRSSPSSTVPDVWESHPFPLRNSESSSRLGVLSPTSRTFSLFIRNPLHPAETVHRRRRFRQRQLLFLSAGKRNLFTGFRDGTGQIPGGSFFSQARAVTTPTPRASGLSAETFLYPAARNREAISRAV